MGQNFTIAYTDGGATINNSKELVNHCGSGVVLIDPQSFFVSEKGFYSTTGTNNVGEVRAIIYALRLMPKDKDLYIFTDSAYAIGLAERDTQPKKNVELWVELKEEISKHLNVIFTHVKGHADNSLNNLADEIVGYCRKNKRDYAPHMREIKSSELLSALIDVGGAIEEHQSRKFIQF